MSNLFILIDAGHGRETAGKKSPDGQLQEWKWAREMAYLLSLRLNAIGIPNAFVVTEDKDISLAQRCERVNSMTHTLKTHGKECFLISIHVNAAKSDGKWHDASGFTAWVYNKASKLSRRMANIFGQGAESMSLDGNRYVPEKKYFEANFKILRDTTCPAVLCENMFMDNEKDVEFLLSQEGKEKLLKLYENSILLYEETLLEN